MGLSEGSVFAGFVIERRLGVGGMGAVYAARHPRLPRLVALKVLNENLCSDPEFRARFEREAELAARVDHPNVVSVYDRGVEGDQLWIAMQYVDGVDVHQLIKRSRSGLTPRRAVFILTEAAKGLDSAHRRGLLHRDVKPANILVAEDSDEGDHVLVTDFGIARAVDQTSALTNAGSIPATLPFASPEQIASRKLDHRSDIYSLGCTLYTMLTGTFPFPRDSQIAVMHAHLTDPPPHVSSANPAVPTEMDEVIARAMAKEPEQRYRSCREFASAAQVALLQLGSGAEPSEAIILGEDSPSQTRSDPSITVPGGTGMVASAGLADTVVPGHRPAAASERGPEKPRSKRGMIVGGAVLAVVIGLVIAGRLAFGGDQPQHTPVADTSSAPPAASTAAPAGPWEAYDFVAKALPGLMPDTPSGTAYQEGTCQPVNARFDPVAQLDTAPAVARIMCRPPTGAPSSDIANYIVICSSDRTPPNARRRRRRADWGAQRTVVAWGRVRSGRLRNPQRRRSSSRQFRQPGAKLLFGRRQRKRRHQWTGRLRPLVPGCSAVSIECREPAISRTAVMAGICAALLAGCGHDGGTGSAPATSAKPPAVDVSTLDTGKYLTLPRRLGQVASEEEGRMAEAIRMAEAVADPMSVDPTLVEQVVFSPLITPADVASNISMTGQAVVAPVLAKYGMVSGRLLLASNTNADTSGSQRPDQDVKSVLIMLVRFPDATAAKNAAVEMDAADFAVSPDNVPVPVTKYPAAHGHWRPSNPSMASTLARDDFVIHVLVANPTPNLEALTGMVEKTFDSETAALDRFSRHRWIESRSCPRTQTGCSAGWSTSPLGPNRPCRPALPAMDRMAPDRSRIRAK